MSTENDNVESSEANNMTNEKPVEVTKVEPMSNKLSTIIMALIVAIPTASIVAYIVAPNNVDQLFTSVGDSLSASNETAATNYSPAANNWGSNQEPQWVAEQRADMEKRRQEFEQLNADAMVQNRSAAEQPQWVKDQQAQMQQQQAKFQEWARQSAERAQNQQPRYAPAPYQYNNAYPNPYNYNNAPRYYGPYNAPYGYGYPNR